MNKLKYLILLFATVFVFNSCDADEEERTTVNYVTFESTSFDFPVDVGTSATNDIIIYSSEMSSSARTYNVKVVTDETTADPTSYTVPEFASIPANSNVGTLTVNVSDINIGTGVSLVIELTTVDGLYVGAPITLNITQVCPNPELFLDISFDAYPEEQYWELYDANDVLLYEGGTYLGESSFSKAFCLAPGSYQFLMGDTYGDGGGPYTLTYDGVIIHSSNGGFGSGEVIPFTLP